MREQLVRRGPPPPLEAQNSTENPLWIDKYVKPYEEQELTMRVASDSESPARLSNSGAASANPDQPNPYATIQKPKRALPSIHLGEEVGESNDYYATLESPYQGIRTTRSSGPQIPGIHPSSSTSFILPVSDLKVASYPTFNNPLIYVILQLSVIFNSNSSFNYYLFAESDGYSSFSDESTRRARPRSRVNLTLVIFINQVVIIKFRVVREFTACWRFSYFFLYINTFLIDQICINVIHRFFFFLIIIIIRHCS